MGCNPREIEEWSLKTLRNILSGHFTIQQIPEFLADVAVCPLSEKAKSYHSTALVGLSSRKRAALVVPVNQHVDYAQIDLDQPEYWVARGYLAGHLLKMWEAFPAFSLSKVGEQTSTTRNQYIENRLRNQFAEAMKAYGASYAISGKGFGPLDGTLTLRRGKTIRCQERVMKFKRDRGKKVVGLFASTKRKNGKGYEIGEVDALTLHVRRSPSAEHVLHGTFCLPIKELQQQGFAPKLGNSESRSSDCLPWRKAVALYPRLGLEYVRYPKTSWADEYFTPAQKNEPDVSGGLEVLTRLASASQLAS
ncbi:unnamed protein product [Amoebophrya sp. A25]|nr:unnamed protein product [Amoebophrya sp. A25]|eukprot:GSA25T00013859001.1